MWRIESPKGWLAHENSGGSETCPTEGQTRSISLVKEKVEENLSHLLELLNSTLIDTTALVNQVTCKSL